MFGHTDWAIMFILARGGQTYARLEFHVGPGGSLLLPVEVDFTRPFPAANQAAWWEEYHACVQQELLPTLPLLSRSDLGPAPDDFGVEAPLADDLVCGTNWSQTRLVATLLALIPAMEEEVFSMTRLEQDRFQRQQDLVPANGWRGSRPR